MSQIEVELQDMMGTDRAIAEAAWTSSRTRQEKEKRSDSDVERLVRFLIKHGHATPVEMVCFKFWIKMPIFTDRQHMTHRIGSHNGMSGRYRTMPDEYLALPNDVRGILQSAGLGEVKVMYASLCDTANEAYRKWLEMLKKQEDLGSITNDQYKRVREVLRGVLPQSAMTERVTLFNLRSFANYQRLRNDPHAQPEIQEVARLMLEKVEAAGNVPVAIAALKEAGWRI